VSLLAISGVRVAGVGRDRIRVDELEVRRGEILAVLGPTGAGKSTLLAVMHLLLRPEEGVVSWQGAPAPWPAPLELRRQITMAFQDPLPFAGSVLDNVVYGLQLRGVPAARAREQALDALKAFRVDRLATRHAATLSGGEAQRMALARALAVAPELLLLDEPLASLDEQIREALLAELVGVVRARGVTCVLVTHDQAEAFAVGDRIAVLRDGQLAQVGPPEEIYYRPGDRFVAEFVRTGNVLPGRVVSGQDGLIEVAVGSAIVSAVGELPPGAAVTICLRPEEILLGLPDATTATSARNRMIGVVERIAVEGPVARVTVDSGCTLSVLVTRRSVGDLGLRRGARVGLTFKATAVHVIADGKG
jgi:molybdopterin-binding protein